MSSGADNRLTGAPDILYGTAFKFEESQRLVEAAIEAGFRGLDTAGSAVAYREKLVGQGVKAMFSKGVVTRKEFWIQTKFSPFKEGRDPALYPYDMNADITTQVEQSVQSSLTNFGTDYIDCLVLHSLCPTLDETLSTWKAMEALVPSKVTYLGISNTDLSTLRSVFDMATIKPLVVQNRFTEDIASKPNPKLPPDLPYPEDPYDRTVREFCYAKGISYAPWGVLWGNPTLLENMEVFTEIGREFNVSKEIACFACIRSLTGCKISILCGTTNTERMTETIEGLKRITEYAENPGEKRKFWQDRLAIVQSVVNGAQQ